MQNSFSYERFRTYTRFETEAQENSEMAYYFDQKVFRYTIILIKLTSQKENLKIEWSN